MCSSAATATTSFARPDARRVFWRETATHCKTPPPLRFLNVTSRRATAEDDAAVATGEHEDITGEAEEDQYRRVTDPAWIERELLRDDTYPTSRGAAFAHAAHTGDLKGAVFCASSVETTAVFLVATYISFVISHTTGTGTGTNTSTSTMGGGDGGATALSFLSVFGDAWPVFGLLALGGMCTEVTKLVESVLSTTNRRNM